MSDSQSPAPSKALAEGLAQLGIPPIVVLCGSTRFMAEMAEADRDLTWSGHIVLKPGCDMKTRHPLWADPAAAEDGKVRLDELHRAKIRLAHQVLVVGDYIGDSTRAEIAYARQLGKPVHFTHREVDPGQTDSDPATGQDPRVLGMTQADDAVVAYRTPDQAGALLCREHGRGRPHLFPLTAEDLPEGGICTWGRPGPDECGRDVLAAT